MTSESKMEKAFYFRLSAPHRYSRDSLMLQALSLMEAIKSQGNLLIY